MHAAPRWTYPVRPAWNHDGLCHMALQDCRGTLNPVHCQLSFHRSCISLGSSYSDSVYCKDPSLRSPAEACPTIPCAAIVPRSSVANVHRLPSFGIRFTRLPRLGRVPS